MKVLCFGSLNIDYTYTVPHFVGKGETLSADSLRTFCGGKGLNQSVALARAGLNVCLAGAVGGDGGFLLEQLRANGVDPRYVQVLSDLRTGHAIIQNDAEGDNCILVFRGANGCTTREHTDRVLANYGPGDLLVLQNEINDLGYIMELAAAKGMRIALTPAPMTDEVKTLPLRTLNYLFLNETECARLLGGALDPLRQPEESAQELRRLYTDAAVLLTLGERGCVYADGSCCLRQEAIPVQAVDTTGAGDTFMGYFLASRLEGASLQQALHVAALASAIAVTRHGASASIPTKDEVLARLWKTTVGKP